MISNDRAHVLLMPRTFKTPESDLVCIWSMIQRHLCGQSRGLTKWNYFECQDRQRQHASWRPIRMMWRISEPGSHVSCARFNGPVELVLGWSCDAPVVASTKASGLRMIDSRVAPMWLPQIKGLSFGMILLWRPCGCLQVHLWDGSLVAPLWLPPDHRLQVWDHSRVAPMWMLPDERSQLWDDSLVAPVWMPWSSVWGDSLVAPHVVASR